VTGRLQDAYDVLLVDLDGVVHLGDEVLSAAPAALAAARAAGLRIRFVTNNAARTAEQVADRLSGFGVEAEPSEVVTSSAVAARVLADRLPRHAPVLVVGGDGLRRPVAETGLCPVASADDDPVAVVQGWSPDLTWSLLAEGALAVRRGAWWVATNADATLPSPRGPLPGNGSMVAAIRHATGREPDVVGKPAPDMFAVAAHDAHARSPLVVGDRLDTDIAGAVAAGLPSLLVLTGVSTVRDLLDAPPQLRPTYVGRDLSALEGPAVVIDSDETARGVTAGDGLDPLREACRRTWAGDADADAAAEELGIDSRSRPTARTAT
jgi:HAD superfamily hydrolase (TIGR01450 family)